MRKIKEVLRLKWVHNLSNRQIAKSCSICHATVREYLTRALLAGLSWPIPEDLDDGTLERLLFPSPTKNASRGRQMPPMEYLFQELKRKGVTVQLRWFEYRKANPEGDQYSQFCNLYRQWVRKLNVTLPQDQRDGGQVLRFATHSF